jgi:hypothetical protein
MMLFKSQLVQEAARRVAGPYRQYFAPRYGRRVESRKAFDPCSAIACNDDVGGLDFDAYIAEREILRRMADYDIAA